MSQLRVFQGQREITGRNAQADAMSAPDPQSDPARYGVRPDSPQTTTGERPPSPRSLSAGSPDSQGGSEMENQFGEAQSASLAAALANSTPEDSRYDYLRTPDGEGAYRVNPATGRAYPALSPEEHLAQNNSAAALSTAKDMLRSFWRGMTVGKRAQIVGNTDTNQMINLHPGVRMLTRTVAKDALDKAETSNNPAAIAYVESLINDQQRYFAESMQTAARSAQDSELWPYNGAIVDDLPTAMEAWAVQMTNDRAMGINPFEDPVMAQIGDNIKQLQRKRATDYQIMQEERRRAQAQTDQMFRERQMQIAEAQEMRLQRKAQLDAELSLGRAQIARQNAALRAEELAFQQRKYAMANSGPAKALGIAQDMQDTISDEVKSLSTMINSQVSAFTEMYDEAATARLLTGNFTSDRQREKMIKNFEAISTIPYDRLMELQKEKMFRDSQALEISSSLVDLQQSMLEGMAQGGQSAAPSMIRGQSWEEEPQIDPMIRDELIQRFRAGDGALSPETLQSLGFDPAEILQTPAQ